MGEGNSQTGAPWERGGPGCTDTPWGKGDLGCPVGERRSRVYGRPVGEGRSRGYGYPVGEGRDDTRRYPTQKIPYGTDPRPYTYPPMDRISTPGRTGHPGAAPVGPKSHVEVSGTSGHRQRRGRPGRVWVLSTHPKEERGGPSYEVSVVSHRGGREVRRVVRGKEPHGDPGKQ